MPQMNGWTLPGFDAQFYLSNDQIDAIVQNIPNIEKSHHQMKVRRVIWTLVIGGLWMFSWWAFGYYKKRAKSIFDTRILRAAGDMERHIAPWIVSQRDLRLRGNWRELLRFFVIVSTDTAFLDCMEFYKHEGGVPDFCKDDHIDRAERHFIKKPPRRVLDKMRGRITEISRHFNASRFSRSPEARIYATQYAELLGKCLQTRDGAVNLAERDGGQFIEKVGRGLSAALILMAKECKE
ncbi:hypothetical protein C4J81_12690 [Deltaproteobacteria bacterium Smac51]|nr:hypothetical protein C4J81_12690 [Deltaproteobacteria bacterium Smac51]